MKILLAVAIILALVRFAFSYLALPGSATPLYHAMYQAEISDPIPTVHAFNADDNFAEARCHDFEQGFGCSFNLFVETIIAVMINNTDTK